MTSACEKSTKFGVVHPVSGIGGFSRSDAGLLPRPFKDRSVSCQKNPCKSSRGMPAHQSTFEMLSAKENPVVLAIRIRPTDFLRHLQHPTK